MDPEFAQWLDALEEEMGYTESQLQELEFEWWIWGQIRDGDGDDSDSDTAIEDWEGYSVADDYIFSFDD